jgi:extracellular elastinolytic metalloproteinase
MKILIKVVLFLSFAVTSCFSLLAQNDIEWCKTLLKKEEVALGNEALRLSTNDIEHMIVSSAYLSPTTKWHHFYFNQTHEEIEVYNALLNVVIKEGKIAHLVNQFIPKIEKKVAPPSPAIAPIDAIGIVSKYLNISELNPSLITEKATKNGIVAYAAFKDETFSPELIKTQLYWLPNDEKTTVRLVWNVVIYVPKTNDWLNVRIDAKDGTYIEQNNWTAHCDFGTPSDFRPHAHIHAHNENEPPLPLVANSYNVFDIPLEAPTFGGRTLVVNPYTRFAPYGTGPGATNGWHDNGTTSFTNTKGNNVEAKEDTDGNNTTIGASPNSPTLEFDFPYTFGLNTAVANQNAAITNLFYWNNLIHDVLHKYGMDEPSGNFQANNLGRGGLANDFVFADAQDGAGTNNANFSTPIDGSNGRMQMFLWSATGGTNLNISNPSTIAGNYSVVESNFSINNKLSGTISGNFILVDDAGAAVTTSLGCATPFDNAASIAGKIAVIDRGGTNCSFVLKVKNAQNAGAIAVLVVNNVATTPIAMGGTDNTITIPAFMISQASGNNIKAQLTAGQTVVGTLSVTGYQPDGDFDNGIIAHEYGHGWSTRLTGGPANSSCLGNVEQMGEGWSDYLALMLTTNWANLTPTVASANIPRGIGTYAIGQATTGNGIRPFRYSYNMASVNPTVTYSGVASSATFSQPHGIGSIWCTILWDMTWEIIMQDNQIINDITDNSLYLGNTAALKLTLEGLRLQKCSPSFVDGRDAILKADEMLFNGKYKCSIWKAFARRGLGVNASTGTSSNDRNVTQNFDLPGGVTIKKDVAPLAQNEDGNITFTLTATCGCSPQVVTIDDNLPVGLTYINNSASGAGAWNGTSVSWANQSFAAQEVKTYTFQAKVNVGTFQNAVIALNDDFDGSTPSGVWIASAITGANNWIDNSSLVRSGTNAKFAANSTTANTDFILTSGINFNVSGPALLSFWHSYDTEADWDGGVVELEINNSGTWIDLGPYFVNNGYNGTVSAAGRNGFSGDSQGWILSQVSLEAFCGQTIRVRFRMITDDNTGCSSGNCGWFVEDVIMNIPAGINNTVSIGNSTDNACLQVTDLQIPTLTAKVFLNHIDPQMVQMSEYLPSLSNFPTSDPYRQAPLNTNFVHVNNNQTVSASLTALSVTGNNAIVDWVFLELRSGVSGATSVVSTRAALLQRDGDIVDMDGVSPVKFSGAAAGSYFVTVRHRNHLGFRTSNVFMLSNTPTVLDFTNNSTALNGSTPLQFIASSSWAMQAGDANADGSIDALDTILWEQQNGLFDDYNNSGDYNLDGSVDALDSILWELNNGKFQELD